MDKYLGKKSAVQYLYPPIEPFDQQMLDVGDGHHVYVEQSGNPEGQPVLFLHGGPGGGCSPTMRRYFNPQAYRVILFDQRGCGRSVPRSVVEANTTWHLVSDIEAIRNLFGIENWILFGGSWGAALALIYAQTHPDRVTHIVLRGVFTMTEAELDWFYGGGAGKFWPDQWARFCDMIPEDERDDLIKAYHQRLFCGDLSTERKFAQIWSGWENALATIGSSGSMASGPPDFTHSFARLEAHYFLNKGFLSPDQQILANMDKIKHIPGTVVQGRYDMICPPETAWRLGQNWPKAQIRMVPFAGHAMSEPQISQILVETMDALRQNKSHIHP